MAQTETRPLIQLEEGLDRKLIKQCVHCGLCLPSCPTYKLLGVEMDSPRGRIYQMKLVSDGVIQPSDPHFQRHISLCLDCRACQSACPSGVQYGTLIEATRALLPPPRGLRGVIQRVMLRGVFTRPALLDLLGFGARLYQKAGLRAAVRRTGLLGRMGRLGELEPLMPEAQGGIFKQPLPERVHALGKRRARVAMIAGCVMPQFFARTNRATARVLAVNGCEVWVPRDQVCCGALHVHSGDREAARQLARRNIEAFEREPVDAIIINAAGCGSTLKEYGELLKHDPEYAERAERFAGKVKDITEFLAAIGPDPRLGPVKARVTYSDPCHLCHAQGVREQPRSLLRRIPELQLVEMRDPDMCCGSAGIYNITHSEEAAGILQWKLDSIAATQARLVATGNPGCMIQIQQGLRARGLEVDVVHPVDLLERSYQASGALR